MSDTELLIDDLKKLAKKRDQQAIIAFTVERDGTVRCVTYGETPVKCRAAGWWGQGFMNKYISIVPFQTVFGWGNGGTPLPLNNAQLHEIKVPLPEEFLHPDKLVDVKSKGPLF